MKYINALLGLVLCIAMAACDDEMKFMAEGDPMQITISAKTKYSGAQSRAVLGDEVEITGYTFLYYVKKDGNLTLSNKTYSTTSGFSVVIECPGTESNLAILIANAPEDAFDDLALGSNISELNNYAQDWTHTYNNPPAADDFTWSGYQNVTQDTRNLSFTLNPNVAKVTLTINDQTGTSELKNIRLKRIRDKVRYAQKALYETGYCNESNVEQEDRVYVNYDMENMELSKVGDNAYSWYIPHNEPIHVSGKSYSRREGSVPSGSTFIEIDDQRTSSTNLATSYRLYPGISEKDEDGNSVKYLDLSNFKVIADYQYDFTVNITQDGMVVEQTTNLEFVNSAIANTSYKIKLQESNNCYMIHPRIQYLNTEVLSDGSYKVKSVWEMPVHQRINEYWGSTDGDAGNVIDDNTEWQAEVIWQDIKGRAFYFCDEYATEDSKSDVFEGLGKNPIYFMLDSDRLNGTMTGSLTDDTDIYGNILIGVKKVVDGVAQDDYLWSWHLWVTDYNPDAAPAPSQVSGTSNVYGFNGLFARNEENTAIGQLDSQGELYASSSSATTYSRHLYDGNVQHYSHTSTTFWTDRSKNVWDTGIYANKWIMDRNLGAQSPNSSDIKNPLNGWGLYYQFGRKDPFSYASTYDINGNERTEEWEVVPSTEKEGTISLGVQNPNAFYTIVDGSQKKWASDADENDWFNPDWYTPEPANTTGAKTLFDPCPPGWCVPVSDAFYFGTLSNVSGSNACFSIYINTTSTAYTYTSDPLRHFAFMVSKNSSGSLYTSFPLQGYVKGENGYGSLVGIVGKSTAMSTAIDTMRGCIWANSYSGNGNATLIQIQPSETNVAGTSTGTSYDEDRNGRIFKIYYARMSIQNWITSRGQNVRCIQEPD